MQKKMLSLYMHARSTLTIAACSRHRGLQNLIKAALPMFRQVHRFSNDSRVIGPAEYNRRLPR